MSVRVHYLVSHEFMLEAFETGLLDQKSQMLAALVEIYKF